MNNSRLMPRIKTELRRKLFLYFNNCVSRYLLGSLEGFVLFNLEALNSPICYNLFIELFSAHLSLSTAMIIKFLLGSLRSRFAMNRGSPKNAVVIEDMSYVCSHDDDRLQTSMIPIVRDRNTREYPKGSHGWRMEVLKQHKLPPGTDGRCTYKLLKLIVRVVRRIWLT